MNKISVNSNGISVMQVVYPAYTNDLQNAITTLMDRLVANSARCTLGELGYLHRSSLVFSEDGQYHLRVFFDARCATRPDPGDRRKRVTVNEFGIFSGYMFVGDPRSVLFPDTVEGPETEMFTDEAGRQSIRVIDQKSSVSTPVIVMECSIPVTMAAIEDVSILDRAFRVIPETCGNRMEGSEAKVVRAIDREIPVNLTVEYSASDEIEPYDPSEAIPYLRAKREQLEAGKRTLRETRTAVSRDAATRRRDAKRSTPFNKYT